MDHENMQNKDIASKMDSPLVALICHISAARGRLAQGIAL
jgi:hypothetical protein